jgi:hypothetical protein
LAAGLAFAAAQVFAQLGGKAVFAGGWGVAGVHAGLALAANFI